MSNELNNNLKCINLVWLSKADLTNLNSGEGESNYIDVKKYKLNGVEYPYVSGQAMRFYLKEAIRKELDDDKFMCIPNDKGETCGDISSCLNCDLFGFMTTVKGSGSITRTSPVKMSPAIGLLPFEDNSNVDFLTRKHMLNDSESNSGDIVNVEIGSNIYKAGVSIDCLRVGHDEKITEDKNIEDEFKKRKIELEDKTKGNYINRIINVLEGIGFLSDQSKQSRLLTDFTPDIIFITLQNKYNHRLQKIFDIDNKGNLNLNRIKEVLTDIDSYQQDIFFGITSSILNNEEEVKKIIEERKIEILTPNEAINKAVEKLTPNN